MKRQISILACLLVLVAIVFAVASCTRPEAAHVHDYVESVTKEATCTEKGAITYTCSCGETYTDETAALGHDIQDIAAVAPTCTTDGKTAGKGCKNCDLVIVEPATVSATGHKLGAAATCTAPQTCLNCDAIFVEALGHKKVAATCTDAEYCSVCKEEFNPALGHKEVAATCTDAAYCSVCTEELAPALGHELEYACLSGLCHRCGDEWLEATEEHEYFYACDIQCSKCYELTNWEASHQMVYVEAKDPTCTEYGNIEYWRCEFCAGCWNNPQAMYAPLNMQSVKVDMLPHEYTNPCDGWCCVCNELTNPEATHSLVHVDAVAPTCTEIGNVEHWTCEYCGGCWDNDQATGMPLNKMSVRVSELGHTYTYECDGWCARCNEFTNPDAAHKLTHHERVEATCTVNGNVEYWSCEFCGGCWDNDKAMYAPLNQQSKVIPAPGHTYAFDCDPVCQVCYDINTDAEHDVVHVAAKAATCTEKGNIEHWYCSYCNLCWIDEDLTLNTNRNSVVVKALGHKGYDYDRKCDACNIYLLPEEGVAFKLGMYQANKKQQLYITGKMSGYYYATTTDPYKSPDLFIEEVDGGFYMYFMDGENKTYLYLQKSGTHNNVKFGSTAWVWTFDEKTGAFISTLSGVELYLGTFGQNITVSASETWRITGEHASDVDKTQFIARPEVLPPHDCNFSEATCTKASTCTICYKVVGEKLPHTPGEEATCTAAQKCTVCKTTLNPALPHVGGNATCTEKAVCDTCGNPYGDLVPHAGGNATCTEKAVCDTCDQPYGELADHNYVDGYCSVCSKEKPGAVTVSKTGAELTALAGVSTSSNGGNVNGKTMKLDDNITAIFAQGKSSTAPAYYSPAIRLYQNGATLTIKGEGMTTIVITVNSSSGDGPISVVGGTASKLTNMQYTITVNEGVDQVVITTTGTDKYSRVYVSNLEVTYEK